MAALAGRMQKAGAEGICITKVLPLWVFIAGTVVPFLVHFGSLGGPKGSHFVRFGGLVASLAALGAQFARWLAPSPPF